MVQRHERPENRREGRRAPFSVALSSDSALSPLGPHRAGKEAA